MKRGLQLAMLLLAAAAALVSGCSQGAEYGKTGNSSDPTAAAAEEGRDRIAFSLFNSDTNADWDDMQSRVGNAITEKTGVSLKMEFPVGASDQKIAIMASSGEYPDLILGKGGVQKLIDAGAMLDLTPYLDQYGPNLKKVYGDSLKRLRYSNSDHAIYVLPTTGVDQRYFDAEGGFELQIRVLKELGYPRIRTVQDYEAAIKAYIDKHPVTDGEPTLGLSLNTDDWHMLISVTNPAFYATGGPDDGEFYINQDTYEATFHYQRPEEKEYFRWLNHMNSIGLIDPESFVQKYDQYKAKIASGRVLGLIDQKWDFQDGENVLKRDGKFDQTYAHFPVTLNESIKDHAFQDTGYLSGWGIGITTTCKDPVRAIQFLDWLASDEGQILLNWGVEGSDYKIAGGKRVMTMEALSMLSNDPGRYKKESGIGNYWISARYGDGVKDSTGNYYTTNNTEQYVERYSQADKETLKAYYATTYLDLWPKPEEFPVRKYGAAWGIQMQTGSDVQLAWQKCEDIMKQRIPEAVLVKPEEFDRVWDAFMEDLDKAGVQMLNEQWTQLVKDRVKLWNE